MRLLFTVFIALFLFPAFGWSAEGKNLHTEVQASMKRWKYVSDSQAEIAARELLSLYREVQADETLTPALRKRLLKGLRVKLDALSVQILNLEQEEQIPASQKASDSQSSTKSKKKPQSVKRTPKTEKSETSELGQLAGGGGFAGNVPKNEEAGEQLVDVIQTTIHPDSWEQNGGNGTIQLWMPNGHLIIRQTNENHEKIQNLLDQLRRAGG